MYLTKLHVKNFWSYIDQKLEFNYTSPVLISGKNGAGKTAIFEAILWGLFGRVSKNIQADKIINNKASKDCCVIVKGEINNKQFKIERYRKHSNHKNKLISYS